MMLRNYKDRLLKTVSVNGGRYFLWIAASLLAVMAALQIGSATHESPTKDEQIHLEAGYIYLTTGEYSMDLTHPPLVRILAALPLLSLPIQFVPANRAWPDFSMFLWRNPTPARTILFRARLVVIILTVLFGAWLAWWTRRYFGTRIALVALTFFA